MVRLATPADVEPLCASLARAFDDDPVAIFTSPRAASRPRRLAYFYRLRLRSLLREEMCFCDPERRGAAVWAPHDAWRPSAGEQLRLLRMTNHRALETLVGFARTERAHPEEPHYYLSILGVSPEAQGQGLGSALLAPMLERCDREGVPAYLESSKASNVAFYGRHGFRVTGEVRFPRGPTMWLMWRDPR